VECSTDTKEAEKFADQLKERFPSVPVYISTLSAVVGAHTGPGVLSVSMIEK
jgi:fatty acid-binding protein DegV